MRQKTLFKPYEGWKVETRNKQKTKKHVSKETYNIKNKNKSIPLKNKLPVPSIEQPLKEYSLKQRRIHIFGDSHAKGLSTILQNKGTNDQVFGCANSGARLEYLLANCEAMTENFTKSDVIITAGNNDVGSFERGKRQSHTVVDQLNRHLKSAPGKSHVVVNLFHRHDLPYSSCINREIKLINKEINQLYKDGTIIVDVSKLGRRMITGHGQHLNSAGKASLCERISKAVYHHRLPKESEDVDMMNSQRTYSSAGNCGGSSLSTVTPESSPATLPFDSYADAVSSTPGRASISSQQHQLQ
ncbi:hypothetical protein J6590_052521 [Homalodisca vitripennis]|nr:hypothetical protein J6590_052521 [Homalodisca vitripennis]